jgi:hypothetical protein
LFFFVALHVRDEDSGSGLGQLGQLVPVDALPGHQFGEQTL